MPMRVNSSILQINENIWGQNKWGQTPLITGV
jgi:hypothetical protein